MTTIFDARQRPINLPDTPLDKGDMLVKTAWGYDLNQWNALTPEKRAYCRENVTSAPYFEAVR
ncbi:hypothetical protein SEA_GUSANITA_56 [Arthrobacter phage Gusanita]|nr:hypothetical protein SEA_GUSANITA_56 [Arthrobacter phage Gusanita]